MIRDTRGPYNSDVSRVKRRPWPHLNIAQCGGAGADAGPAGGGGGLPLTGVDDSVGHPAIGSS